MTLANDMAYRKSMAETDYINARMALAYISHELKRLVDYVEKYRLDRIEICRKETEQLKGVQVSVDAANRRIILEAWDAINASR